MKTTDVTKILTSLSIAAALSLSGCMTTGTRDNVIHNPMTPDLEKQVLAETGLGGLAIGSVLGGAVGYGLGYGGAKVTGHSDKSARQTGMIGGIAGLFTGGAIGYQKGQEKGQQVVDKAKERDQLDRLARGARNYNKEAGAYNDRLRSQIRNAQRDQDENRKRATLARLRTEAVQGNREVAARINEREKAVNDTQWDDSKKGQYRRELDTLRNEQDELQQSIDKIKELEGRGGRL